MGPNALLAEIRRIVSDEVNDVQTEDNADRLATLALLVEKFGYLDEWIKAGGFLPTDWKQACR